ncbi:hypothetical protein GDO81_015096 [Engystomops pustulosus]|uniref:LITAF domain-containing protein n=1 Tax=Engystomops pustulosus TaxID=76066 RepID=A0AAV7ARP1_ENGPU|nr:hypothetical protein GDO81_015096 [Engystomops pustulosus]
MFDAGIPSTTYMDNEPPPYQPSAVIPSLPATQYCIQPVPTMTVTQPQAPYFCYCLAISEVFPPCHPKVIYQQPVPVCVVEAGLHQTGRRLADSPSFSTCPSCHENVVTTISFHSGLLTWLLCTAIMCLGFLTGCCLIPFCVNATKDVHHFCPRCNCCIYKYRRL